MNFVVPMQKALEELVIRTVGFLPHLLAGLITLLIGWFASRLISAAAERLAHRLRLDENLASAGWSDALETSGVGPKPSKLLARLIFWTLLAIFGVLALENLGLEFTTVPLGGFLAYLPRLLGTVLILCLGAILAVMAGTAIQASLVAISFKYHRSLASGAKVLILTVVVLAAIENLGFDISFLQSTLTNLITIFAAGLTVMFVLGGKVTAGNLLAGYYAREQFRVGDWIQLEAGQGELKAIGAVASEIVTSDGDLVVPNRLLVEGTVLRRAASSAGIDPPQA